MSSTEGFSDFFYAAPDGSSFMPASMAKRIRPLAGRLPARPHPQ
jgi:hypothetical protein